MCVLCNRNKECLKKNLKIAYVKVKSELSFYQPQRIERDRKKMKTF